MIHCARSRTPFQARDRDHMIHCQPGGRNPLEATLTA